MARFIVLLLAAGLLLFAACDDDGDGGEPTATSEQPSVTAAPTATEPAPAPTDPIPFEGARDPVEVPGEVAPPVPELMDVRTGKHEDFDRVVFEFRDAVPGYRVEYISPPATECGSGFDVPVNGDAALQVQMSPAAAHNDAGESTFALQELSPGLPSILEVERTCDFEGILTWVVGLVEEADFSVFTLQEPARVVVDVAHP